MSDENTILDKSKNILKKLEDLMKCEVCKYKYDYSEHKPMVNKCGHTFCKKCLFNKLKAKFICPLDGLSNTKNSSDFSSMYYPNLLIEIILKEILNINEPTIKEKYIVYSKPDLKRRNSPYSSGKNTLTNNSHEKNSSEGKDIINNNGNININSGNQIINVNAINVNIGTRQITLQKNNNNKEILKDVNNENNDNNDNIFLNASLNDDLNTFQINDEINVNNNKIRIENEKINDDSIETIPINDEKTMTNISFRDDFKELLNKNDDIFKTKKIGGIYKGSEDNNNLKKNINVNLSKTIKTYNKKSLTNLNSNNKDYNNQIINPNEEENDNNQEKAYKENENDVEKYKKVYDKTLSRRTDSRKKDNTHYYYSSLKNSKINGEEKNKEIAIEELRRTEFNDVNYRNNIGSDTKIKRNLNLLEIEKEGKINRSSLKNLLYASPQPTENDITTKNENKDINNDNCASDESKGDSCEKSNKKNMTVFRKRKKLNNDEEISYNNKNNISNTNKNPIISKIITSNSPNTFNKKSNNTGKSSNLLLSVKNNLSNQNNSNNLNNSLNNNIDGNSNQLYFDNVNYEKDKPNKFNDLKMRDSKFYNIYKNKTINNYQPGNYNTNSMTNSNSYQKKSPRVKNNIRFTNDMKFNNDDQRNTNNNESQPENNQNIVSIYINMNNKTKNMTRTSSNPKIMSLRKFNNVNHNKPENSRGSFDNEIKNEFLDKINKNNDNLNKNNKILNKSIIEKLRNDFNILFENENDATREKYERILNRAIESPFLNNEDITKDKIKIKFLTNNDFFIGIFEENDYIKETPKKGILYTVNGDYYEGEFVNGKKEGNGIIIYKNGTKYEGKLKQNKHNGFGKLTQLDGEVFIGEWKDGKINGTGTRYHSNGDKYVGNYKNNIRNGNGHYMFSNGDSYEGNWENGKANGQGKFRFQNGNMYQGEFKDNLISGNGSFTMKNGDIYIGTFTNGLMNGEGTLIYKNGERFVGNFKNSKKDGEGNLYDSEGKIIKTGMWEKDKFIEENFG